MKQHEKAFFSILRTSLWKTPLVLPDGFSEFGKVMAIAKSQALMGLVSEVMLMNPKINESLSDETKQKFRLLIKSNIATYHKQKLSLARIVITMRENGVEPVLLKGLGLAEYYPVPELRQCGDIDIYVGKENYEKAYDALLPIVTEIDKRSQIWEWMHFDAKLDKTMLEVHYKADYMRSRRKDKAYQSYMQKGLSENLHSLTFGDFTVMTPHKDFNAFYVFYHLWRHFSGSGIGLRQFCDWACFLHAHVGKLNLEYLNTIIRSTGLMKPWQVFGCFLVKELGLPEEDFPFYNPKYLHLNDKVRTYVMTDGNFGVNTGYSRVRKYSYLREKWISFRCHATRALRMFSIFPKHVIERQFYVIANGILQVFRDVYKSVFINK